MILSLCLVLAFSGCRRCLVISYSLGDDKHTRCTADISTSINNFIPFPDPWGDKHVACADVDTPGNYPTIFPSVIKAFQAAWSSGEKFQRH